MLSVTYNAARSLSVYLQSRPASDPSAVLYGARGEALGTVTCARDAVATTTAAGAAVGAQALTLTSAADVAVGRRYLVGGGEELGGETVTVKAIAGAVVTLARPLILARDTGVAFEGARVTFEVPAQQTIARGYRAEIDVDPPVTVAFDVTRYSLASHVTLEDVRDLDPTLTKRLPPGTWWPGVIAQTWDVILRRIAMKRDPGSMQGTVDLTLAHAYLVRATLAETAGKEFEDYRVLMANRAEQELDAALVAAKWDGPTPGVSDPRSGWRRGIKVIAS